MSNSHRPTAPNNLSEYAVACLEALAESGLGRLLSLGGAVGLSH